MINKDDAVRDDRIYTGFERMTSFSAIIAVHYSFIHGVVKSVRFLLRVLIQMGGSSSKPAPVEAPGFDYTKAKVELPDVEDYEDQVKAAATAANDALNSAAQEAGKYQGMFRMSMIVLVICAVAYVGFYYVYPLFSMAKSPFDTGDNVNDLNITSAEIVNGSDRKDITPTIIGMISRNNELHIQVDDRIGATSGSSLRVNYQYTGEQPKSQTIQYGKPVDIVKQPGEGAPASNSYWTDPNNMLVTPKDAKQMSIVTVPSNSEEGNYGYQFWMYVTDWNYKFGEEKPVMSRDDPTNSAIMNPQITLHPTDNTMKIAVSVFPNDATSKAEPAPAGHSGATDDVFICEIPNIPLQTWLAVSVTLSTRNLDVYLNGKLVKSCFLTGVPKPVTGSVTLNKDGGYSGWLCSFFHYPRLLVPADAQAFFGAGVPCNVPGTSTNYNVTFGIRDTKGQVVSKYVF